MKGRRQLWSPLQKKTLTRSSTERRTYLSSSMLLYFRVGWITHSGVVIVKLSLPSILFLLSPLPTSFFALYPFLTRRPSLIVAEVDADSERELGDRFNIEGFPTLKFFPAGASDKPEDYDGDRTAEALVSWVNDRLGTLCSPHSPPRHPRHCEEACLRSAGAHAVQLRRAREELRQNRLREVLRAGTPVSPFLS